jgi:hypothetical protein
VSEGEYPPEIDVTIDARRFQGVWANAVRLDAKPDAFTLDFIRVDPREGRGMVVARVTCSPHFARSLIDDLERLWQTWAEQSLPREARGHEH